MPAINSSKYTVHAGWDDIPHLDEKTKRELWTGVQKEPRSGVIGVQSGPLILMV